MDICSLLQSICTALGVSPWLSRSQRSIAQLYRRTNIFIRNHTRTL